MKQVYEGDNQVVLQELIEAGVQVDAVVTDPPYGLSFMNKKWDYDVPSVDFWKLVFQILKPGGHVLSFGGTRTYHRMVVNLEDAGFEIRDQIVWLYGCLSSDTDIFADGKWRSYTDLRKGMLTPCYDIKTRTYSLQPIEDIVVYDYDDTAYRIQSDHTDQIVSKNHRCLIEQNGMEIFEFAENAAQKSKICVPILEDMSGLLNDLSVFNEGTNHSKKNMFRQLQKSGDFCREQISNSATERSSRNSMCGLSEINLEISLSFEPNSQSDMFETMQRTGSWSRMENICPQRQEGVDRRISSIFPTQNEWIEQSSMEGWCNKFQNTRSVQRGSVHSLPNAMVSDGSQRWLYNGASTRCSSINRQDFVAARGCTSHESRSIRQSPREFDAVCYQSGSQIIRASRYTRTDLATITPINYQGKVWCVRVGSGAFVARRNGKCFVTGNSGFPKSMNISKAIDKSVGYKHSDEFVNVYTAAVEHSGLTYTNIDELLGIKSPGSLSCYWARTDDRRSFPAKHHWIKLKQILNLTDELDIIYERANREIVATKKRVGKPPQPMWNEREGQDWTETIPATPESQQWEGWGTALKPAMEPVVLARKPLSESTIAANVLLHGTGGLNIDDCRVELSVGDDPRLGGKGSWSTDKMAKNAYGDFVGERTGSSTLGRFPANVIMDEEAGDLLDEQSGQSTSAKGKCHAMAPNTGTYETRGNKRKSGIEWEGYGDTGGASRFFYCAKASKKERRGSKHPTVKPLSLMRYLCRLITPPGGIILDPFAGSGTTGEAAVLEGFMPLLIEREAEYIPDIEQRLAIKKEASLDDLFE